jgi:hypothetical protein
LIFEVKSGRGGNSKRAKRQQAAAMKVLNYLYTDTSEGLYVPGQVMSRLEVYNTPVFNLNAANAVVREARLNGSGMAQPEPGLYYVAFYREVPEAAFEKALASFKGSKALIFTIDNEIRSEQAYCPMPLMLADVDRLCDYYEGQLVILVIIDWDELRSIASEKGLAVEYDDDQEHPLLIRHVGIDASHQVSRHFLGRIGYEFLSLAWFMSEISHDCEGKVARLKELALKGD